MEVRIRHIDESSHDNRPFAEADDETGVSELIDYIERCGGVYVVETGETEPYHSRQIVIDGSSCYVELIVGAD